MKTCKSQQGEQGKEMECLQALELNCQQQSDALHRSGERSQDFPNPGAPTGLQKTHPSAHRQTALPRTRETPWEAAHVPGDLPVKAVFVQGGLNPSLAIQGYCTELEGGRCF